jgi:hypothetical protein
VKLWKSLLQAGVMAAGLILVLITLSGTTRTIGIYLSVISIGFFLLDAMLDDSDDNDE